MPPLMLRWRPLHITILSLGTIASSAWADPAAPADPARAPDPPKATQAPLCPSQATADEPTQSKAAEPTAQPKPNGKQPAIETDSDSLKYGVNGDAILQGHVTVRQGDRKIKADEIEYNPRTNALKTDSGLEYEDPVVRITGNGGNYSPNGGANFRSATFDLRQRAERG